MKLLSGVQESTVAVLAPRYVSRRHGPPSPSMTYTSSKPECLHVKASQAPDGEKRGWETTPGVELSRRGIPPPRDTPLYVAYTSDPRS
eukprot:3050446-Pyramimonas_sp.AAC.1